MQGQLLLDHPYPVPQPVELGGLPFCGEFRACSCCNASHANSVQFGMQHVLLDTTISPQCRDALTRHHCSVCDPQARPDKLDNLVYLLQCALPTQVVC